MTKTQELELIAARHKGVLRAADVVAFARNPNTALHKSFQWDDTRAAAEYRLWQARELIRTSVTILPSRRAPVRVFVSLKPDRTGDGGGYRRLVDVLSVPEQRQQLLRQALQDFRYWQEQYNTLQQLRPVFRAAESVRRRCRSVA